MNIQQFKYILAVAEHRHFELAADKCFITQSTLSTMISKFEDEIGIKIFDRKKKPVEISNEGRIIIEQLKVITNNISELDELIKEVKGETKGNLSISIIPTISPYLLPLFLQDFAKKFPDLQLEVREQTTNEIIRQIKSRDLDIGIISVPMNDNDLIELELFKEPFVLYDSSRDIARNSSTTPNKISIKNIDTSNLWLMEEEHCMRTQVLSICDLAKTKSDRIKNIDFKAGSLDSLIRFVKTNKATTLLPYLSTVHFSEKDLECIQYFSDPVPLRTIGLVVHKNFVKKKILDALQKEIVSKVSTVIVEAEKKGVVMLPV